MESITKMLSEILEEPEILKNIEKENKPVLEAFAYEFKERKIKHVTFAARGTSDHAAIFGQYLFTVIGGAVSGLALCSAVTAYDADIKFDDDLVIGISQSGSALDVSSVVAGAKEKGALTLSITNYPESRLAKSAKYHLFCATGEEKSVAATKTFTAQLSLILLACAYAYDKKELLKSFNSLSGIISKAIKQLEKTIDSYTKDFVLAQNGFVLSRGMTYPIALEAALKLQETCYVKMRGCAVSDFWHGPLAQVDSETPVIILCAKGACLENDVEMAEKVKSIGAHLLVVTDDKETAEKFEGSCLLPSADCEFTSPFVFAAFVQMFAQSLCLAKGMNPDSPRNLNKVTITV